jgi:hypothetical protein
MEFVIAALAIVGMLVGTFILSGMDVFAGSIFEKKSTVSKK